MESPFITHRNKVLGYYNTASWLRQLVLAMWSGSNHKVGLSQLAGVDEDHAKAALDMLHGYRKNGENDPAFMTLADECLDRLKEEGAALQADID
jgi:hypothetical protein